MIKLKTSPVLSVFLGKKFQNIWLFLLVLIPNFLAALLEGVSFVCILIAFTKFAGSTQPDPIQHVPFLAYFTELIQFSSSFNALIFWILVGIALQAFRSFVNFYSSYLTSILSLRIQTDAQTRVFKQVFRLSFPCISRYPLGELAEYTKAPSTFINPFLHSINGFISSLLMSLVSLGLMLKISIKLTAVTLTAFFLVYLFQRVIIQKIIHKSKHLSELMASFGKLIIQHLEGIRLIHTYHRHKKILADSFSILNKISETSKRLYLINHAIPSISEVASVLSVASVLICALFLFDSHNQINSSYLITFLILAYRTASRAQLPVANFSNAAMHFGPIMRLQEILKDQEKEYLPSGGVLFTGFSKKMEFHSVTLRYEENLKPAIDNLSFTIERGFVTAIVGGSGGGKSSILDLIIRLYEPTDGKILIDGTEISRFELESWRSALGVVSQDPFIFNESVEENIRFGIDQASLEEIQEAAKLAQAHDFIMNLSDGYRTKLGEKGYKLSGGQLQRLSLARALVKNPQILILDEATSNLDSLTEQSVHQALKSYSKNRTTIIIAHRLSTIIHADQILYIENGKLVERGIHSELITKGGKYATLWKIQSDFTHDIMTCSV